MKINTALILCAGFGKRLNPLTLDKPKSLLKFNDITLLENTINLVKNLGINKIILNTFYLKEKIEDFLNKKNFDISIKIIDDGKKILDTGGGILNMLKTSEEDNFLVLNPDTIWNSSYLDCIQKMEDLYNSESIKNILMVVNKDLSFDKNLKGDFKLVKNKLKKEEVNQHIFTGCQIINKNLFNKIKKKSFSISLIWNQLIIEKNLYGFESKSKFYHITNLEIYKKLIQK